MADNALRALVPEMREPKRKNKLAGVLADWLKAADEFGRKPFGYDNPPAAMLSDALGVPAVASTLDRVAYGDRLTQGQGQTLQLRPEVVDAGLAVAPIAAKFPRATLGAVAGLAGAAGDAGAADRAMLLFHGSPNKFNKFSVDADKRGVGGIWATEDKGYADWIASKSQDKKGNTYKIDASPQNPYELDIVKEANKYASSAGLPPPSNPFEAQEYLASGVGWDKYVSGVLKDALGQGHDSLMIKNFNDNYHSNPFETTTAWVFPESKGLKILERNGEKVTARAPSGQKQVALKAASELSEFESMMKSKYGDSFYWKMNDDELRVHYSLENATRANGK